MTSRATNRDTGPVDRTAVSRRASLRLIACGLGLVVLPKRKAAAHKFHFSTTLIELNHESRSFEITVRLFADDLEQVLGERAKRRIEIDRSPDAEMLTFDYVREVLRLRAPDMQEIPLAWVGLETKVDSVYCYLEANAPQSGFRDLAVSHAMFFELQRGQTNIVTFREAGAVKPHDLVFRPGDRFKVVIYPEPDSPSPDSAE
jgi:hypothetical protein